MTKTGFIVAHQGVKVLVKTAPADVAAYSIKRKSDLVVGDNVKIENDRPILVPRRNVLKRSTPYGLQAIAANLDGVGIVVAEKPPVPRLFADQVIMVARKENIDPFIVVNKCDLKETSALVDELKRTFDIPIWTVSARAHTGVDDLREYINKLGRCVFLGVSGVGKSSLLNTIVGDAIQKTGATVDKERHGAHTTSQSVLFSLEGGGELIDSPGLRDFSPPELPPSEIAHLFTGFAAFLKEPCRFHNCLHVTEPGCVIKTAVAKGALSKERYEIYLELLTFSQQNMDLRR